MGRVKKEALYPYCIIHSSGYSYLSEFHRQAVRVLDLGNEASRTLPTKVGIAQPQRRPYGSTSGHHQVPMSSKSSQVLGENSVASKHKRFSLGIARSTDPTTRSAQQVRYSHPLKKKKTIFISFINERSLRKATDATRVFKTN